MLEKYERQLTNDEPIEFKGLKIFPIKMKDYFDFMNYVSILTIDKNSIPDARIISMSYLDFLILMMTEHEMKDSYSYAFYELMKMCTQSEELNIYYGHDEKKKIFVKINDVKINRNDFDKIKEIILYQNIPNYKFEDINPELRAELEEKARLENNGKKMVSIEKQIMSIVISSSLTFDDVMNLTIRKFSIVLDMIDKKMNYKIYKTASLSGMVEFKNEIDHYLVEDDTSTAADKVMDVNTFTSKITQGY